MYKSKDTLSPQTLTGKQERFSQNVGLIYFVYNKNHKRIAARGIEYDDAIQLLRIGLWKACKHFNGTEASWSSFAVACMERTIFTYQNFNERKRREDTSLEAFTAEDTGDKYWEPIAKNDVFQEILISNMWYNIRNLKYKWRYVIEHHVKYQRPFDSIAQDLGVSKEAARQLYSRALRALRRRYHCGNY